MNCIRLLRLAEKQSLYKVTTPKYISNQYFKFSEAQERWRERDGVSKEWQLIYKAPMDNALKYTTTFLTLSSSTITVSSLYYGLFVFDIKEWDTPVLIGDNVVIANNGFEFLTYLGAFILFHSTVKIVLNKFVLRLYQNGDDYLAIFRGHWFNSIRKHKFTLKEFKKLSPTFVVTWGDARYGLGKKHGILLENYFKTPEYLNYLLTGKKHPEDKE